MHLCFLLLPALHLQAVPTFHLTRSSSFWPSPNPDPTLAMPVCLARVCKLPAESDCTTSSVPLTAGTMKATLPAGYIMTGGGIKIAEG